MSIKVAAWPSVLQNAVSWSDDGIIAVLLPEYIAIYVRDTMRKLQTNKVPYRSHTHYYGTALMLGTTDDTFSLTEVNQSIGHQLAWSPAGLSRDGLPILAIRTSDFRTAIYRPTRDPYKYAWLLTHLPYKLGLELADCDLKAVTDTITIRQLRQTCMTWTPASADGRHFLVAGTQSGHLLVYAVFRKKFRLAAQLQVSVGCLNQIQSSSWNEHQVYLAVADTSNAVFVVTLTVSLQSPDFAVPELTAAPVCSHDCVCNNMRICHVGPSILVACTFPGLLYLIFFDIETGNVLVKEHPLGYIDQTAGLLLLPEVESFRLLALGYNGKFLATQVNQDGTLDKDQPLHDVFAAFIKHQLDRLPPGRKPAIRFFGVDASPNNMLAAVSFETYHADEPRYVIAAKQESSLKVLQLKDPQTTLKPLLKAHLRNAVMISSEKVRNLAAWTRVKLHDLLEERYEDSAPMPNLRSMLFCNPNVNAKRLLQIAGDPADRAAHRGFTDGFLLQSLVTAASLSLSLATDPDSLMLLQRLARFVLLFRSDHADLLEHAKSMLAQLQQQEVNTEHLRVYYQAAKTAGVSAAIDASRFPVLDQCRICEAPIHDEDSLNEIHCASGHSWRRCCATLAPLMTEDYKTCPRCKVVVHTKVDSIDSTMAIVSLVDGLLAGLCYCPHCGGNWRYAQAEQGIMELDPRPRTGQA